MKLFGQLVRTLVNTALVPVAVVSDVFTLGGISTDQPRCYTLQQLQKIKDEASDDSN